MNPMLFVTLWLALGVFLAYFEILRFAPEFLHQDRWFLILAVVAWPFFVPIYIWLHFLAKTIAEVIVFAFRNLAGLPAYPNEEV